MSFYQKYRPKKIAELDLKSVREMLQSALLSGKISHAYLFVGPRGSGKTSTARILAQVINCEKNISKKDGFFEPCGVCEFCQVIEKGSSVDVIEIDAASNGLVDDIRDLRNKVNLAPVQLKKKVYIIDEVHMVSTSGFNALLKTLEEPPEHVMFILCTTELQKVPDTILSRCAKISFTKGSIDEVIESLMKAVKGEGLEVERKVLETLAEATDGSFREGHKILEQVSSLGNKIEEDLVIKTLGVVGKQSSEQILNLAFDGKSSDLVKMFENMENAGVKAPPFLLTLIALVKKRMEGKFVNGGKVDVEIRLLDLLIDASEKIKVSPVPLLPIEIALLRLSSSMGGGAPSIPKVEMPALTREDSALIQEKEVVESNIVVQNYDGPLVSLDKVKSDWMDFLNLMSANNGSLAGMLRLVSPIEFNGKSLTLSVSSRFQQEMLERDVKKKVIEEQMAKVWGPITFKCVLSNLEVPRYVSEVQDDNLAKVSSDVVAPMGVMEAAEKIFGG